MGHPAAFFGPYRLLKKIGAGGMGEVYLAEDPILRRRIALKLLPDATQDDPALRERFLREGRAIAALNHPNIVTIHAVGEQGGRLFLAMEFVEGRPLSELIRPPGLSIDRLLGIGSALADAIASAHSAGVIHRDLKPANIMVREDDLVKVLDFGLARIAVPGDDGTTVEQTSPGHILGTAAYMSPEQAEGKAVDERSDIFALGIVLYEMATGQRPFKGDSNLSVLSAILRDTPPAITTLRPDLPPELARIIKRCLAKPPELRYQTAKDLRSDLALLRADSEAASNIRPQPERRLTRRTRVGSFFALLAVLTAVSAWALMKRPGRLAIKEISKVTRQGNVQGGAISPDGSYVAYVSTQGQNQTLWLQQLATGTRQQLVPPQPRDLSGITFAADGQSIFYCGRELTATRTTLFRIPLLGGNPVALRHDIDLDPTGLEGCVTFSPDFTQMAHLRRTSPDETAIIIASVSGTSERTLVTKRAMILHPVWSPDGQSLAVPVYDGASSIFRVPLDGSPESRLATSATLFMNEVVWLHDGSSLLATGLGPETQHSDQLWHIELPSGTMQRITADTSNYTSLSVTRARASLATVQYEILSSLLVGSLERPHDLTRWGDGQDNGSGGVAWLSNRIVFASGNRKLFAIGGVGADPQLLTPGPYIYQTPASSADGRYVFFRSTQPDGAIWRMNSDGGGVTRIISDLLADNPQPTPDGKWVFYSGVENGREVTHRVSSSGGSSSYFSDQISWRPSVSPDGKLIAGTYRPPGQPPKLHVLSTVDASVIARFEFAPETLKNTASAQAFYTIRWSPDGRSLIYATAAEEISNLWEQPLSGGLPKRLTNYSEGIIWSFDVSPAGDLVIAKGKVNQDLVIISLSK